MEQRFEQRGHAVCSRLTWCAMLTPLASPEAGRVAMQAFRLLHQQQEFAKARAWLQTRFS